MKFFAVESCDDCPYLKKLEYNAGGEIDWVHYCSVKSRSNEARTELGSIAEAQVSSWTIPDWCPLPNIEGEVAGRPDPADRLIDVISLHAVQKPGISATVFEIVPKDGIELENDVADRVGGIRFTAIEKNKGE